MEEPDCRILVANSVSGGTGLNLQIANYVIFYESPVSPIHRLQAEWRCYRAGQTKAVFIYDLVVAESVDEKILEFIKEGKNLLSTLCSPENKGVL